MQHVQNFHGLPVLTVPPYTPATLLPDAASVAWRLQAGPYITDEDAEVCWERFTSTVELEEVRALVLGYGMDNVSWLTDLSSRLTGLEAVFLGDIEYEEAMISSIDRSDLAPLLEAFPGLRELAVRGGDGLAFPVTGHAGLRALRIESGGLPPKAAESIAAADLPALERLELWLGDDWYGGGTTVGQLAPLLAGARKPALRHLGLQNSPIQDELAAAVASAAVVPQLTSLSLAMGTLSDEGAEALLHGQPLTHLKELDLSHHYLSDEMMLRIWRALEPAGVRVNLRGKQERDEEEWEDDDEDGASGRYIAVAE
ncbi:STM4015 family protein [Streptomyces sp. DSM 41524]|uniref:STM4015 family protein n=1 Tax=Streptomyces asiaticus subsp. ignotus TaxID=3098222 RepID=A0ABU7Q4X7_9ACTN|nr:STM4015 family protein [Streptomyces sp. DSM 41524]